MNSYKPIPSAFGVPLTVRTQNCLHNNGIASASDLLAIEHDVTVLRWKNAGRRTLREIREAQRSLRGDAVVDACQPPGRTTGPPVLDRIADALESIAESLRRSDT